MDKAVEYAKELRSFDELEKNIQKGNVWGKIALDQLMVDLQAKYKDVCFYEYKNESIWTSDLPHYAQEDAVVYWGEKKTPILFEVKVTKYRSKSPYFLKNGYWYLRTSSVLYVADRRGRLFMACPDSYILIDSSRATLFPMVKAKIWGGYKTCFAIPKDWWVENCVPFSSELKLPNE